MASFMCWLYLSMNIPLNVCLDERLDLCSGTTKNDENEFQKSRGMIKNRNKTMRESHTKHDFYYCTVKI